MPNWKAWGQIWHLGQAEGKHMPFARRERDYEKGTESKEGFPQTNRKIPI